MDNRKFKLYSDKIVEMKPVLTGGEADNLYKMVGSDGRSPERITMYNAVAHLVSIDGVAVVPLSNATAFKGVLDRFNEVEHSQLIDCYSRIASAMDIPEAEELKNE